MSADHPDMPSPTDAERIIARAAFREGQAEAARSIEMAIAFADSVNAEALRAKLGEFRGFEIRRSLMGDAPEPVRVVEGIPVTTPELERVADLCFTHPWR